ncbi:hypothetical protein ATCC90586_009786 [Pythium insidiosum]|nr:hypothetical protein ATCC90586_009786 [Pythium insidiosum]
MKKFGRSNVACATGRDATSADAVFVIQPGGVLKNVIVGANNVVGVFCAEQNCALENVWFDGACQAAVVVEKGQGTTTVRGGGARHTPQRVVLQKAAGRVQVSNFYAEGTAEIVESCSTCGPVKRQVSLTGLECVAPKSALVRVNKNYNDEAEIDAIKVKSPPPSFAVCTHYEGGRTPVQVGSGAQGKLCSFAAAAIHYRDLDSAAEPEDGR